MPLAALASSATTNLTFGQHLVLWLHIGFAVFTIGPLTVAISSTPRYIRKGDVRVVRYLARMTFVFLIASLGVLVAGVVLSQMRNEASKPYLIVSETLFLVTIVLLVLIVGDQRRAIRALAAAETRASVRQHAGAAAQERDGDGDLPGQGDERLLGEADPDSDDPVSPADPKHVANVERSRIAMLGGLVSLIYLVILALMIFNN